MEYLTAYYSFFMFNVNMAYFYFRMFSFQFLSSSVKYINDSDSHFYILHDVDSWF